MTLLVMYLHNNACSRVFHSPRLVLRGRSNGTINNGWPPAGTVDGDVGSMPVLSPAVWGLWRGHRPIACEGLLGVLTILHPMVEGVDGVGRMIERIPEAYLPANPPYFWWSLHLFHLTEIAVRRDWYLRILTIVVKSLCSGYHDPHPEVYTAFGFLAEGSILDMVFFI